MWIFETLLDANACMLRLDQHFHEYDENDDDHDVDDTKQ